MGTRQAKILRREFRHYLNMNFLGVTKKMIFSERLKLAVAILAKRKL